MPHLYILGLSDSTHYCGISRRIVKRILDHQKGRSKSTRMKRPIVIKYITEKATLQEARDMEVKIKKQGVTRWWIRNQNREDNIKDTITANSQQPTTSATQTD